MLFLCVKRGIIMLCVHSWRSCLLPTANFKETARTWKKSRRRTTRDSQDVNFSNALSSNFRNLFDYIVLPFKSNLRFRARLTYQVGLLQLSLQQHNSSNDRSSKTPICSLASVLQPKETQTEKTPSHDYIKITMIKQTTFPCTKCFTFPTQDNSETTLHVHTDSLSLFLSQSIIWKNEDWMSSMMYYEITIRTLGPFLGYTFYVISFEILHLLKGLFNVASVQQDNDYVEFCNRRNLSKHLSRNSSISDFHHYHHQKPVCCYPIGWQFQLI